MKRINDTTFWDERHGKIFSKKGGWKIGQGVFNHGYSMMEDLVGKASYMQVMVLNATGHFPDRRIADWLESIYICLSYPDSRIWCNQIGALNGETQASVVAATSAGNLAMDSHAYGARTLIDGMSFIQLALKNFKQGLSVEEIVKSASQKLGTKPVITGYARPIAKGDERIDALEQVAEKLGFPIGEHLNLAYKIEQYLCQKYNENMNFSGYVSAFMSDQGFTAEESYRICSTLVSSGVTACYADSYERVSSSFLPLRCDDIAYEGKPERPVPEK